MSSVAESPLVDVLLVTADPALRELVSRSRTAGVELVCVTGAELRERSGLRARQVWVDLDTTPEPLLPVGSGRVYFYTDARALPEGLPAGLLVRKPCAAALFATLWAEVVGDGLGQRGSGGRESALPAWLADYHELGLEELCRRIARGLSARLGYRVGSVYLHDGEARVLTLAATSHGRPIERIIRLDDAQRFPAAAVASTGQVLRTEHAWDEWLARGIVRPGDFPYADGACLLAPLSTGGEMWGVVCLCERTHVPVSEDDELLRQVFAFLARCLRHARLYEAARHEARIDSLTGLYNQRWMTESLDREIRRAERYASPLALLMVDLDGLKAINDQRGHAAGDAALRHAAKRFLRVLRQSDGAARTGGDEFCIVLPETAATGAEQVARRLLESFREAAPELELCGGQLTASIGVAEWERGMDAEQLRDAADRAMYRAKQAGGNQVAIAAGAS
ncbi:MAG: sensor domain-containing diguanylate cyclase [Phycisphaerales bacterium]|nr:sensor domain-containing diguanylate cyclase [Phycisphaerales bacterium]